MITFVEKNMRLYIGFLGMIFQLLNAQMNTENWQKNTIKTFFLTNEKQKEWIFYPINQVIQVHFDVLESFGSLAYRVLYCTQDWSQCSAPTLEQIQGFAENTLTLADQYYSQNTRVEYIHFNFQLPNANLSFIKTGHYLLQIYDEKSEEIVGQRRLVYYNKEIPLQLQLQEQFATQGWETLLHLKGKKSTRSLQNNLLKIGVLINQNWNFFSVITPVVQNTPESLSFYFKQAENVFPKQGFGFRAELENIEKYNINRQKALLITGIWHYYLRSSDWIFMNNNTNINSYKPVKIQPSSTSDYIKLIIQAPLPDPDETTYLYSSWTNYKKSQDTALDVLLENGSYSINTLVKQGQYPYWLINCKKNEPQNCHFLYPKTRAGIDDRYDVLLYYEDPLEQNYTIIGSVSNL